MKIPALDRGLRILDYLIKGVVPRRYSDIRDAFAPISDASLNRLLKTLINCGYVEKDVNRHYCITEAVNDWKKYMGGDLPVKDIIAPLVDQLANQLKESAAFAILNNNRIEVLCSTNIVDSFSIVHTGSFLNVEADHAAVIAMLDSLPPGSRDELLKSPYCTIKSSADYETALAASRNDGFYSDTPISRLGMNRLAIPVVKGTLTGGLFLCAPTERKDKFLKQYAEALTRCREEILQRI